MNSSCSLLLSIAAFQHHVCKGENEAVSSNNTTAANFGGIVAVFMIINPLTLTVIINQHNNAKVYTQNSKAK